MSNILYSRRLKTRTAHVCFGCARKFPSGAEMHREGVVDGNSVFTVYLCKTCREIQSDFNYGDEFGFGELASDAIEYEAKLKGENDERKI